jgi:hypothetical protein
VHFFELRLEQLPELRLDNREIIELRGTALTGPVGRKTTSAVNRSFCSAATQTP